MKLFKCPCCGQLLYFENTRCESCGRRVGYVPEADVLTALDPVGGDRWEARAEIGGQHRFCANAAYDACNWLLPSDAPDRLCLACRHNRTIPDTDDPTTLASWRRIESAKHRLFYTILRLGLPRPAQGEAAEPLVFDFLADAPTPDGPKVMTAERETRRAAMGEPYRTLLGHFRHEVGHFYWDVLVRDGGRLEACRAVFGDDREDYQAALKRHYAEGVPEDWQESYISAYATTHAWEDFAETWAHYLHIIDTLEMARAFGMTVAPRIAGADDLAVEADVEVYREPDIRRIVDTWVPLAFGLNSVNRCMGQGDLYPFILSAKVVEKLGFIHRLVREARAIQASDPAV